jgi:hypothetical protein
MMMKTTLLSAFLIIFSIHLYAQEITYEEITAQFDMPEGIKIYKGTRAAPALEIFYTEIDLAAENIAIRPYLVSSTDNVKDLTEQVGAYLSINGGFFSGSTSFSSVVYPEEVKAVNVRELTRSGTTYPVVRSFFGLTYNNEPSIDWIYHFDNNISGIRKFDAPLAYDFDDANPLPAPLEADGAIYDNLMVGIGGAPVLVKNSMPQITYNEEIMWGSGVGLSNRDPRSAVGFTTDNKIIFVVADGRQPQSEGVSLIELADIMIDLGCVEALNLDGGGSSQMAVKSSYINTPSETRNVPSILVVTHSDSLNLPEVPIAEYIVDTEMEQATIVGSWTASANTGFYGDSPSLIKGPGTGNAYVQFQPQIIQTALYEVYGWWVASGNRAKDTPYVVNHLGGADTVRVDQAANGSSWQFIGRYLLDENANVAISDAATEGSFVVADAIKFSNFVESFALDSFYIVQDEAIVPHEESITINVLENDNTYNLSAVNMTIIEASLKGTAVVNDDLSITYTPREGEEGSDLFTYQVCYGQEKLLCGQARVFLDIEAGEPPVLGLSEKRSDFTVYPNPANNLLYIKSEKIGGNVAMKLSTLSGQIVLNQSFTANASELSVPVNQIPSGLYILEIAYNNKKEVKKISIK